MASSSAASIAGWSSRDASTTNEVTMSNNGRRSFRDSLIGAWRLISCKETDILTGEEFRPMGDAPEGLILYTPDGYMSAQLSAVGRPDFASGDMYAGTPEEYTKAGLSYL